MNNTIIADTVKAVMEKLNGKQAGIIVLVVAGIAGVATGSYYLVKEGLKALAEAAA